MGDLVRSLSWEDPLEKGNTGEYCRLRTPVFWPGEFHGLYSPWGHKESDTSEQLHVDVDFVLIFMITLIAQLVKNLPAMQETPV